MFCYIIIESVGFWVLLVYLYEDLYKYYFSVGCQLNCEYGMIYGEFEEICYVDGCIFVKKDFIFLQDVCGLVEIFVLVFGYVYFLYDDYNIVQIYDKLYGMLGVKCEGQVLYMVWGSLLFVEGVYVSYGQLLGEMGQIGSFGLIYVYVELEVGQFQCYICDINNGMICFGVILCGDGVDQLVLVDGVVLVNGSCGVVVVELQKYLVILGYIDVQGVVLKSDGVFGLVIQQVVEVF